MKKVYNCLKCGKWFEEAKKIEFEQIGEVEVCPFFVKGGYTRLGESRLPFFCCGGG